MCVNTPIVGNFGYSNPPGCTSAPEYRRICIGAEINTKKFHFNPVIESPLCHIELVMIAGGKDNPRQLRSTPECKYSGRCPNNRFYKYPDENDKNYDCDCIPEKYRDKYPCKSY
jgi:hypothetical protein